MLEKLAAEMKRNDDPCPLVVPSPMPAAWTPPIPGRKAKANKKVK